MRVGLEVARAAGPDVEDRGDFSECESNEVVEFDEFGPL